MPNAWDFWHMTPKEVAGRIKAHEENNQRRAEEMDVLAWMVGNYTAQGYYQPRKYPRKPGIIKREKKQETIDNDETMKHKLLAFAEIHNAEEEHDP